MVTMTQTEFEEAIENRFKERANLNSLWDKICRLEFFEIEDLEHDIRKLNDLSSNSKSYDVDSVIDEMECDLKQKKKELEEMKEEWKNLKKSLDGDDDEDEN